MASEHWVFTNLKNNPGNYLKMVHAAGVQDFSVYKRIEPRARKEDFATALSFELYDPLWMLARQWQFGRFKGNDCGSIVTSKVKVNRRRLDSLYLNLKRDLDDKRPYSTDTPMEYDVEKRNRPITPFVRIESALHFKKTAGLRGDLIDELMQLFPLDPFIPYVNEKEKTVETLKTERNANLDRLQATYGKRIFDGYKLFAASKQELAGLARFEMLTPDMLEEYRTWFAKKYLPIEKEEDNCWNEQKLGYEIAMGADKNIYEAEDYHTGKLSWYSFDGVGEFSKEGNKEEKMLSYLPVPACFPGAPNRRLWEFEDANVQLGHQANSDFSLLSNAVVMQYISMYSNDWMITPIEAEAGTVLDVEGIVITDTFGERVFIGTSAEQTDDILGGVAFNDRWSLFGTTRTNAYEQDDFASSGGLLFPPTLPRYEESKPIEEVQFLRDEMANMLWGVETVINDGCDGTLAGKDLSDAVLAVVDEQKGGTADDTEATMALSSSEAADEQKGIEADDTSDYSYLVQNRVPLNWIPFIPQKIAGEKREIRFRRGKMPIFFNGNYNPVRPSTDLLKIKEKSNKVKNEGDKRIILPRFINEEEITGYGVKLVLTAQRTRWFLGESFTWIGAHKVISQYQANSGLMFDELIDKVNNKTITLQEDKKDQDS